MRNPLAALTHSPRNASPVPLVSRSRDTIRLPMLTGTNEDEKLMGAYGAVGTLFAIVNRITNATAQVEWNLWRTAKSGDKEDRVRVTRHAALDLWRKPNPFMPMQEFVETFGQHVELTGRCVWIVGRNPLASLPLELWPVRPDRVHPVPDPKNFLKGYVYVSPDGEKVPLGLDEVIMLRMPNPLDPYSGLGPVQSILTDLESTKFSAEYNKNFFLNSAEPGGIIQVPERLSDDEFDEMSTRWNEQHRGVSKAHRVAIIEHGEWVDRKYTMKDMQFTELRTVSREVIREAFGMPKAMLGTVDDVNRANAEAGEVMFARYLVVPRLERIKSSLNHELLPLFGRTTEGLEFDYVNPVPEDRAADSKERESKARAAQLLVSAGFDGAGVLEAIGLPEIPWSKPVVPVAPAAPPRDAASGARGDDLVSLGDPEAAMRWEAVEKIDDDTCQPCRDNHGKTYRNRAAAYKDYPGGSGYVNCEGEEHGNSCRGKVVKRGKSDD